MLKYEGGFSIVAFPSKSSVFLFSPCNIRGHLDLLFSVLGTSLIYPISLKVCLPLRNLLQRKSVNSKSQVFQKYQMYMSTLQTCNKNSEYHTLGQSLKCYEQWQEIRYGIWQPLFFVFLLHLFTLLSLMSAMNT